MKEKLGGYYGSISSYGILFDIALLLFGGEENKHSTREIYVFEDGRNG